MTARKDTRMIRRENATKSKGQPVTLLGPELKVGMRAPEFSLTAADMSTVKLSDTRGKTRLLVVVLSLDTSVCEIESARFNKELEKMPGDFVAYVISVDLPFAQKRVCGLQDITRVKALSAYKDRSFGEAYGLLMEGLYLLARAVIIVDPVDMVRYVQLVPEVSQEPDYAAALEALKGELVALPNRLTDSALHLPQGPDKPA